MTGSYIWLSLLCMLIVGFISGLFKNLGDRGSGLAISIYVLFILTNAYPTDSLPDLQHRLSLVLMGGLWNAVVGMAVTLFMPEQQPYRRTIANIWKAIEDLAATVAKGWDGKTKRSSIRELYLKKEVRTDIDTSFHFYELMAHQDNKTDGHEYQLAQIRKATAIVAANITAISEELEAIEIKTVPPQLRYKLLSLLKGLQQTSERMATYIATIKPEEKLLVNIRIGRLRKLAKLLKEYNPDNDELQRASIRVTQLTERNIKLLESAMQKLDEMDTEQTVFRSYSLVKTLLLLHPRYWWRNIQLLFNFDTLTTRYALRTTAAATVALFIDKWFAIDHGYWIPFTAMIVTQPYFGATMKKALERVVGTVLGGLVGGLFLRVHAGLYLTELMLFISFIMMVYYIRKQYAVAAFFITISLVILFNMEATLSPQLIVTRALSTVGGAALAIIAGFALQPHWDRKRMPINIANSINCNYRYFLDTFYSKEPLANWTRQKRNAETKNSNAFDSFNRYMQEPGSKKNDTVYFQLITHLVRITRELNNIHLEQEQRTDKLQSKEGNMQHRIAECLLWFNKIVALTGVVIPAAETIKTETPELPAWFNPTEHQRLYIDKLLIELKDLHEDLQKLNIATPDTTLPVQIT
jgi:uncharacterized membrane protein YgaE (UPF0421/DUF939 family)